jgi:hypothetical protein
MNEHVITWERVAAGEYVAETTTHRLYVLKINPNWNRGRADWRWEVQFRPERQAPGRLRTGRAPTMRKAKAAAAAEYRRQRPT